MYTKAILGKVLLKQLIKTNEIAFDMGSRLWCYILYFSFISWVACSTAQSTPSEIINVVGEIFYEDAIDDPDFELCHNQRSIIQYYAFNEKCFTGEKAAINRYFEENYLSTNTKESGWIRIRFIVNCRGEAGRFRLLAMDNEYQKTSFSPGITQQLLILTKALNGWKSMEANQVVRDYYQYLIFKIENGELVEIMP